MSDGSSPLFIVPPPDKNQAFLGPDKLWNPVSGFIACDPHDGKSNGSAGVTTKRTTEDLYSMYEKISCSYADLTPKDFCPKSAIPAANHTLNRGINANPNHGQSAKPLVAKLGDVVRISPLLQPTVIRHGSQKDRGAHLAPHHIQEFILHHVKVPLSPKVPSHNHRPSKEFIVDHVKMPLSPKVPSHGTIRNSSAQRHAPNAIPAHTPSRTKNAHPPIHTTTRSRTPSLRTPNGTLFITPNGTPSRTLSKTPNGNPLRTLSITPNGAPSRTPKRIPRTPMMKEGPPGVPTSYKCCKCNSLVLFFGRHCQVCSRMYCRQCIKKSMRKMEKGGHRCKACINRRYQRSGQTPSGHPINCFGLLGISTIKQKDNQPSIKSLEESCTKHHHTKI